MVPYLVGPVEHVGLENLRLGEVPKAQTLRQLRLRGALGPKVGEHEGVVDGAGRDEDVLLDFSILKFFEECL